MLFMAVTNIGSVSAQPQSSRNIAYDVSLQTRQNGFVTRVHLLYDRGRFRQEMLFPTSKAKTAQYMQIHDGKRPYIAWSCSLSARTAWPLPISCCRALSLAARREGEAAAKQQYHLPAAYHIETLPDDANPPRPSAELLTKMPEPLFDRAPVGEEVVAGYKCRIYELRQAQAVSSSRDGAPGAVTTQQTRTRRAWVEPRTGLILRLEDRIEPPAGSPAPPMSTGYVVTGLRFPDSIPAERFQIPPGINAYIAKIFSDVKLPAGVHRVEATGPPAYVGMGIN